MYPQEPNNTAQKTIASLIVIMAVVLISVGVKAYDQKPKMPTSTTTVSNPPAAATQSQPSTSSNTNPHSGTSATSTSGYKDGTYRAAADYYVPHGSENIEVSLTISGGVVTNSSIQNSEGDPESAQFQEDFAAEYKSYVVGKSISSLQLNRIAGASDTTQAFDNAIQQIKSQATA